jgi:hypothetical protein
VARCCFIIEVGQPLRLEWHSPRPFSAACVMLTASGPVIVKRHHARVRDVVALAEEHRFVAHLQQRAAGQPGAGHRRRRHRAGRRLLDL